MRLAVAILKCRISEFCVCKSCLILKKFFWVDGSDDDSSAFLAWIFLMAAFVAVNGWFCEGKRVISVSADFELFPVPLAVVFGCCWVGLWLGSMVYRRIAGSHSYISVALGTMLGFAALARIGALLENENRVGKPTNSMLFCPYCMATREDEFSILEGVVDEDIINIKTLKFATHSRGCRRIFLVVVEEDLHKYDACFRLPKDWKQQSL